MPVTPTPEPTDYDSLVVALDALLGDERDPIANAANTAALLFHSIAEVSWVGFYFTRAKHGGDAELVLGPFQGKTACVRIDWGRGVCGTAAARGETQRVADVHAFEGHIACDPDARSEVVVPLFDGAGRVVAVLDVDSAQPERFTAADQRGLEALAAAYLRRSELQGLA
ncbi:MAG: GAF domain-containing protein [Pseudomonadota bacterium]